MQNYIRGSSSISRIEQHVSFKVKYCHNVFDFVEFRDRCRQILFEVAEKEKLLISEMGFERNHVHMTWQMLVYHSVSGLSKSLKGTSGKKLLKEFPEIKEKYFWDSGLWSPVIYCDSIGKDANTIKNYVRSQGVPEKHQKSLKDFAAYALPISGLHATSL
jgi:putative transposase